MAEGKSSGRVNLPPVLNSVRNTSSQLKPIETANDGTIRLMQAPLHGYSNSQHASSLQGVKPLLTPRGTVLAPLRANNGTQALQQFHQPGIAKLRKNSPLSRSDMIMQTPSAGTALNSPLHSSGNSGLLRQKPWHNKSGQHQSHSPVPPLKKEDLNSDIMVLISKPQGRNNKLDPLRSLHQLGSSSDSRNTSDSQLHDGLHRKQKSFIYPPDLRTAQEMIRQGTQVAQKESAIKLTDFNKQCTCEDHHHQHQHQHHQAGSAAHEPVQLLHQMENAQDADSRSRYQAAVRDAVEQIVQSPKLKDYKISAEVFKQGNHQRQEAGITVKNENLFNMMQQSVEREKELQQKGSLNLNKIMGSLQTYKDKQNRKDPSRRVNIPYYRKVMSRNKYALSAAAANPSQAIMFSKQLPLLDRSKQSMSPSHLRDHLKVQGEHQCGKHCLEGDEESDREPSRYETLDATGPQTQVKKQTIQPVKKSSKYLDKSAFSSRLSSSMLPKTTDINKQSETLLPQINITNKRLTQLAPSVAKPRERRTRQLVLKPQLNLSAVQRGQQEHEINTDGGNNTDGGSIGDLATMQQLTASNDSSVTSKQQNGFLVLKNGQIALKQQRKAIDQQHLPGIAQRSKPISSSSSPLKLHNQNGHVQSLPRLDDKGSKVYLEGELQPQNRFEKQPKTIKANFNSDLIKVAAEKVHNLEIASVGSVSESLMSNGERVERLLRSVDKTQQSTENAVNQQKPVLGNQKVRGSSMHIRENQQKPQDASMRESKQQNIEGEQPDASPSPRILKTNI